MIVLIEIKSSNFTADNISTMVKEIKTKFKCSNLTSQENIGASIGNETKVKAIVALIVANLVILVYVGIRFEFKFGIAAIFSTYS